MKKTVTIGAALCVGIIIGYLCGNFPTTKEDRTKKQKVGLKEESKIQKFSPSPASCHYKNDSLDNMDSQRIPEFGPV